MNCNNNNNYNNLSLENLKENNEKPFAFLVSVSDTVCCCWASQHCVINRERILVTTKPNRWIHNRPLCEEKVLKEKEIRQQAANMMLFYCLSFVLTLHRPLLTHPLLVDCTHKKYLWKRTNHIHTHTSDGWGDKTHSLNTEQR